MASTPQQSQEDNQADGFSKVKVTILASEWGSSKGGLSTINRELAIQLAKCPEVEITFFLPKCSEEDKNIALGHKIEIVEATRRPGFEELEWLSFPPENLQIDVIVGHGIKLGHQAQVIRQFKKCKWVQVAHTDPEELGMFKNYPDSISKGEEKHKAEVELCEMADLVVGVGPKLSEAFRSYICGCQNDLPVTVLDFTPGVFDEFVSVKQFPNKDKSCSILVFGCGDAEDFEVKGFDIAGKTVATLPNTRLVFVGASDGKHEEIAERFTRCGVPASRLRVRGYMKSREHLKRLFQEVDLVLLPSRTEGFGLTALEALSAGLPVIVSQNSGFGEALSKVPFGSSFVVDSEDPKVWAEAIKRIWDKDRQGQLEEAETLRTCYEKKYSWAKQSNDLVDKMISIVHAMSASTSMVISSGNTADVASNQPTEENTTAMFTSTSVVISSGNTADVASNQRTEENTTAMSAVTFMENSGDAADADEHLECYSADDNQHETRNTPSSQTFSQPDNIVDKRKRACLFAESEKKRLKQGTVIKHSYQGLSDEQQEIVREILTRQIQVYIKHHDVTTHDGVGGLIEHIKEAHHLALKSVGVSSLVINVQCPTLESLESLWDDYCSGHLNEVAERYLVTEEIKRKLNLKTIKLKTTIEKENYLICKEALMETSPLILSQRTSTAAFDTKMQHGELEEALELLNEWRMIDPEQAIDNSKKIPLSTMAMSVVPESAAPYKDPYQNDDVGGGVESCAPRTSAALVNSQPAQPHQVQRPKTPAPEPKVTSVEPQPSMTAPAKDGNVWEARPSRKDDDIPFLTHNHHRILQWMEEGEQAQHVSPRELKQHRHHSPSTKSGSWSKQSSTASSIRQSEKMPSRHLPNQPIASDPLMPPLPAPHASSVLEETKRRLIEVNESERRSKHHPKQRSPLVGDADTSSHHEKNSASSCCTTTDYSSHGQSSCAPHELHFRAAPSMTGSSVMSSVSHADTFSKDSGFSGSVKKKDKNDIIITYFLWGEPIPYRTTLPVKHVTLGQFKTLLPPRKGSYRFYFKRSTDDSDCGVIFEEVKDDSVVLPTFEGKIVGKVERVDP